LSNHFVATVAIGTALCGGSRAGRCTVGALVKNEAGELIALTAWHAFARETDPGAYLAENGRRIGSILPNLMHGQDHDPFWSAIGLILLDPHVGSARDNSAAECPPDSAESMDALLDRQVRRFGFPRVEGRVRATHGILHVTNPLNGKQATYVDTVEVALTGTPGLAKGDAGSLLVTSTGEAVGLIMAGTLETCYVAPIAPLLQMQGLRLVSPPATRLQGGYIDLIRAGNRQLREQIDADDSLDLGPMPQLAAA
jgi:hypothetical protein